jgi:hypothetical protein
MRTEDTKRREKGTRKWWRNFGQVYAPKGHTFISDGILSLKPEIRQILGCKYIWIERVTTSGLTKQKRRWLPKILSSEWLIAIMGKPNWKPVWEIIRPETYRGKRPEDEKGASELLQTIKWRHTKFYKEKYEKLLNIKS